jgi:transposase
VEIYGRVRRAVRVEGRSQRAVAREFGLSRDTVRKMLQYAVPPGYQRQQPIKRPKLGPWLGVIDAILSDDKQRPAKQRHTAKRIFDRLKDEHQFSGGDTMLAVIRKRSFSSASRKALAAWRSLSRRYSR